jgi:hypothetical protein
MNSLKFLKESVEDYEGTFESEEVNYQTQKGRKLSLIERHQLRMQEYKQFKKP